MEGEKQGAWHFPAGLSESRSLCLIAHKVFSPDFPKALHFLA
jgi:hypothetical protein